VALRSDSGWRAQLVPSYPDLFHPAGDPLAAEGWPAVDDGWRELLERACARIRAAVRDDGGSFRATQIKEKYGSLRFYWSGRLSPEARTRVEEAIDLAEARTATTCEVCGEARHRKLRPRSAVSCRIQPRAAARCARCLRSNGGVLPLIF